MRRSLLLSISGLMGEKISLALKWEYSSGLTPADPQILVLKLSSLSIGFLKFPQSITGIKFLKTYRFALHICSFFLQLHCVSCWVFIPRNPLDKGCQFVNSRLHTSAFSAWRQRLSTHNGLMSVPDPIIYTLGYGHHRRTAPFPCQLYVTEA